MFKKALTTALCGALCMVSSPAAFASPVTVITGASHAQGVLSPSDVKKVSTLTVHLPDHNPDNTYVEKRAGVTFTLYHVVGAHRDSETINRLNTHGVKDEQLDKIGEATSDDKGTVVFDSLAEGIYVLTATLPEDSGYLRIPDLVVALPLSSPEGAAIYDAHVTVKPEVDVPHTEVTTPPPSENTSQPPATVVDPPTKNVDVPPVKNVVDPPAQQQESTPSPISGLPMTGASIMLTLGVALVLIATGALFLGWSRKKRLNKNL